MIESIFEFIQKHPLAISLLSLMILIIIKLINELFYKRSKYILDRRKFEWQKKFDIAAARHTVSDQGRIRSASGDAFVKRVEKEWDEKIQRHKNQYRKDFINTALTAIVSFFKK